MVALYHPDFRGHGDLSKEQTKITVRIKLDPFSGLLHKLMQPDVWEKVKSFTSVDPRSLLELHKAYRTGKLNNHTVTVKILDLDKKKVVKMGMSLPEYLRLLGNIHKNPYASSPDRLAELVHTLETLSEALEGGCAEGCEIRTDTPELIVYKNRFHSLVSMRLRILEEIGFSVEHLLKARPNTVLIVLKQNPETIRKKLEALAKEKGVPVEELPKIYSPNTLLAWLSRRQ